MNYLLALPMFLSFGVELAQSSAPLHISHLSPEQETVLVQFFTHEGLHFTSWSSLNAYIDVRDEDRLVARAIRELDAEFAIRIERRGDAATATSDCPEIVLRPDDPEPPRLFLKRFARDSLVVRAYDREVKRRLRDTDRIVSFRYRLLPYVDSRNRRTEAVDGLFNCKRDGVEFPVGVFWFPGQ